MTGETGWRRRLQRGRKRKHWQEEFMGKLFIYLLIFFFGGGRASAIPWIFSMGKRVLLHSGGREKEGFCAGLEENYAKE